MLNHAFAGKSICSGALRLTVLGARGSMPVSGPSCTEFGGATSCYLVETEEAAIILDAGTGIINALLPEERPIAVLITHPHADHLLGLPFFSALSQKDRRIELYAARRGGYSAREQIDRLFSPPLWPCKIADYPADICFFDIKESFSLGQIHVRTMASAHPGGSTVYRLDYAEKSLVYATDFEHLAEKPGELADFALHAGLLLYDGQYTEADYEAHRGYGHSTEAEGLRIAKAAGVKQLCIIHHDPFCTDEILREREALLRGACPNARFARAGDVIEL